jgi:hypothetical protein
MIPLVVRGLNKNAKIVIDYGKLQFELYTFAKLIEAKTDADASNHSNICRTCRSTISSERNNEHDEILQQGIFGNYAAKKLEKEKQTYKDIAKALRRTEKKAKKPSKGTCPVCGRELGKMGKNEKNDILWRGVCGVEVARLLVEHEDRVVMITGTAAATANSGMKVGAMAKNLVEIGSKKVGSDFRMKKQEPKRSTATRTTPSHRENGTRKDVPRQAHTYGNDVVMSDEHDRSKEEVVHYSRRGLNPAAIAKHNLNHDMKGSNQPAGSCLQTSNWQGGGIGDMISEEKMAAARDIMTRYAQRKRTKEEDIDQRDSMRLVRYSDAMEGAGQSTWQRGGPNGNTELKMRSRAQTKSSRNNTLDMGAPVVVNMARVAVNDS